MAKINVKVDVGQEGQSRFVNKTIDVPDNYRFLNSHAIDQNQFEQLQKMPENMRGMAMVGQRSIQNPGGTMQSAATDYQLALRSQGVKPQDFAGFSAQEYHKRKASSNFGNFMPLRPAFHQADVAAKGLEQAGQIEMFGAAVNAIPFGAGALAALGVGRLLQVGGSALGRAVGLSAGARNIAGKAIGGLMTTGWAASTYYHGGPLSRARQGDMGFMSGFEAAGDVAGIGSIGRGALNVGRGVLNQFALNSPARVWMRGNVLIPNEIIPPSPNRYSGSSSAYSDWMATQSPKGTRYNPTYQTGIGNKNPSNVPALGYKGPDSSPSESIGFGSGPLKPGEAMQRAAETAKIIKDKFGIDLTQILGGKGFTPGDEFKFGDSQQIYKPKPNTSGFFSTQDPTNIYLNNRGVGPQTAAHEAGHALDYLMRVANAVLFKRPFKYGDKKSVSSYASEDEGTWFNTFSKKVLAQPGVKESLQASGYKESKYAAEGFARGFADLVTGSLPPSLKNAGETAMGHARNTLYKFGFAGGLESNSVADHRQIVDNIKELIKATDNPETIVSLERHLREVEDVYYGANGYNLGIPEEPSIPAPSSPTPAPAPTAPTPAAPKPAPTPQAPPTAPPPPKTPPPQAQKAPQPQQTGPAPFADPKDLGSVPIAPPSVGELMPIPPKPTTSTVPSTGPLPSVPGGAVPGPAATPKPNKTETITPKPSNTPLPIPAPPIPASDPTPKPIQDHIPEPIDVPKPNEVPKPVEVEVPKPNDVPKPVEIEVPKPQEVPKPVEIKKPNRVKIQDPKPKVPPVGNRFEDIQQIEYGFYEMGGYWLPAAPSFHAGQWATPAYIINSGRLEYNVDE